MQISNECRINLHKSEDEDYLFEWAVGKLIGTNCIFPNKII